MRTFDHTNWCRRLPSGPEVTPEAIGTILHMTEWLHPRNPNRRAPCSFVRTAYLESLPAPLLPHLLPLEPLGIAAGARRSRSRRHRHSHSISQAAPRLPTPPPLPRRHSRHARHSSRSRHRRPEVAEVERRRDEQSWPQRYSFVVSTLLWKGCCRLYISHRPLSSLSLLHHRHVSC